MNDMFLVSALSLICLSSHALLQGSLSAPGIAHAGVWFLVSLVYAIFQARLDVVSPATLLSLCVGIAMFSIGLHVGLRLNFLNLGATKRSVVLSRVPALIVLISAAGFISMALKAFHYVPIQRDMQWFGGTGSWYGTLRDVLIAQHGGSYGMASYSLNLCFAGVAYLILDYRREGNRVLLLWAVLVVALGLTLLATGRTFLLLLICIVLGASMPGVQVRKIFLVLLFPAVALLVFLPMAFLGGRFSVETLSESIFRYSLAPISAYDYLVNADMINTAGAMTFRTPVAVLRALGLPVQVPDLIQPWAPTKISGNVYTVFSPYYRDFGLVGVSGFMCMLGVLHGWVFRQIKTGYPIIIVANAILFYALLMQFFQDQYFSLLSQWIQIIFWTYMFDRLRPIATDRIYNLPR